MVKGPGAEAAEELLDEEGVPGIIDFRFLTTETNLKALYIFLCFFTQPHQKLFGLYRFLFTNFCLQLGFFVGKRKKLTKPFTLLT